jgi:hypothetical protein
MNELGRGVTIPTESGLTDLVLFNRIVFEVSRLNDELHAGKIMSAASAI